MNDHSPEFERQSYRATVAENSPAGTKILQPVAYDQDVGLNARIRYSLLGDKVDRFSIDQRTGEISTAMALDREDTAIYYLTIMAQDSSTTEPRASTVNLTVQVLDLNDNAPTFEMSSYTVNVPDRIKGDQFVFGAQAIDPDEGDNSRITYTITGKDADQFTINPVTGVVKTKDSLATSGNDVEGTYQLIVHTRDHGKESKSSSAELRINLKPADMFPSFSYLDQTQFEFAEDIMEGKFVTKISASSPKKGSLGNIRYSIAGGNSKQTLSIDPNTGETRIGKGGLDFESYQQYEIWVEASDSDRPPLRTAQRLIINVSDTNDNAPIVDKMIYNAEVLEEESPPQLVTKISATDTDSNENGQITFRLVNDYDGTFEIDADTGEIFTNARLDREEIHTYELMAEAVDQGLPQLTGSTTVIITVLDKNDNPPRFTRLFSVNVTENAEVNSFVIKVTSSDMDIGENANASYSFTENPGEKFLIDAISGNVTVNGHLDREQQDEYLLKVAAVDGAWRAETPLTITIQDQNDNAPEFEHSYYSFNFPELQRSVAFVGQVSAADRDKQGPNSVISYSFQQPSDLFTIDPATGEIFSKRTIHYKHSQIMSSPENMYTLIVQATDNGKPRMYSECMVNVNIVDANNNPPKFELAMYLSPVPEGATVGQKVVQVRAKDELDFGVNAEIEYDIVNGNGSRYFNINKMDGWISLSKPLQHALNQVYTLRVKAEDRGVPPQTDDAEVHIVVTGDNRHTPVFTALSYQVIVPENEPVGATILVVSATDNDDGPNGMVRYYISGGNDQQAFAVDELSGAVTILKSLDYDQVQEYHINITARDRGFTPKKTVATLTVTLTDINDNAPVFKQPEYHVYLSENLPIHTSVFTVHAVDKDSPKNAIIEYSIADGSGRNHFAIQKITGLITSRVSFDYEEAESYTLVIEASNPDSNMMGLTKVIVHLTGINEFYPRLVQPVFHFDVSESAEVGTSVGIIQATDKDAGEDGKVYYLLVGSSNDKGFSINHESGVMSVSRNLDRETQSRVVLTVMAKNFGGIRGNDTDEAQVIITIQDGNDPPEFTLDVYESNVLENIAVGTKVMTVKAVDKDIRPQNNQFSYSIIGGNVEQAFKIDPNNGNIETARQLDRETNSEYSLIVGAIDIGTPPETGTAMVKVLLMDVNDNGPVFDAANTIGYVTENEPPGTSVMTLTATDPDLPPNGAPFTYTLVGGRHKSFVTVDKHSGLMKTTRSVDREETPQLNLLVEVEDNGTPRMRSQHEIVVKVKDQNDSPSTARIVHVIVYIANGMVPDGKIADIHPNDLDTIGNYKCRFLTAQPSSTMFIPKACDLHTTRTAPVQGYSFSVTGNDGIHSDVVSTVSVEFQSFNQETIDNTVTVKVGNMTSEVFLAQHYRSMTDVMKLVLEAGDEITIFSMRSVNRSLELSMAIKLRGDGGYRNRAYVVERLSRKRDSFVQLIPGSSITIGYTPCGENICENGGICRDQMTVQGNMTVITDSPSLILTTPKISHDFMCRCMDGYTGKRCDRRQDPCSPNPCQFGATCRRHGFDFQCSCPANRKGKHCELERGDACSNNPCKNGGSCRESADGSSFFCLCRPGYRGNNCETIADSCRPNPCLHGGQCVSLKPGYKCNCIEGRYGRHCERVTYGFDELSYMSFPSLDSGTNDISMIFATTKQNALLVYNYGVQNGGRSDFVAIEIVKGKAVFSFGGARTAIASVSVGGPFGTLSNGEWHKVTATRNGRVMSLSVAKCMDNGDICEDCRPGDSQCYSDDIGPTG